MIQKNIIIMATLLMMTACSFQEKDTEEIVAIVDIGVIPANLYEIRIKENEEVLNDVDLTEPLEDKKKAKRISSILWLYEDSILLSFERNIGQIRIESTDCRVEDRNDIVSVVFSYNEDLRGPAPDMPQSVGHIVRVPIDKIKDRPFEYTTIACHDYTTDRYKSFNYYVGSYKILFNDYEQTNAPISYDKYKSIPFNALGSVYLAIKKDFPYKFPITSDLFNREDNMAILSKPTTTKLKDLTPFSMDRNDIFDRGLVFKIETADIENPVYVDRILVYDDYNEIILREHKDYEWKRNEHDFNDSTYLFQVFLQDKHVNANEYRVVLER